ncbi:glycosyltransferase family 41 protein [Hydnomerulius pinastri MD-312]|nr:glycosyltransferase family 41 protein [Hydnomerulius pinastri MD-312]
MPSASFSTISHIDHSYALADHSNVKDEDGVYGKPGAASHFAVVGHLCCSFNVLYLIPPPMCSLTELTDGLETLTHNCDPPDWDLLDNVLNTLLASPLLPEKTLDICRYTRSQLISDDGRFTAAVNPRSVHRMFNVLVNIGNLMHRIDSTMPATTECYMHAIEVVVQSPGSYHSPLAGKLTFRDFVISAWATGMTLSFARESCIPPYIAHALKSGGPVNILTRIGDPGFDTLRAVHGAGDDLIRVLIDLSAGTLPNIILLPDQVHQLSELLFSSQRGFFPAIHTVEAAADISNGRYCQETRMATASVLLCLARRFQTSHTIELFGGSEKPYCTVDALVLLLHYVAASLFPNASTFNDIGVILCGLGPGELATNAQHQPMSGREVARLYYEKGLQVDPSHPHLLSNLGSLLKDAGHASHAIGIFNHALMFHPELDIALVNMANTLKDTGYCAEAVPYYMRAITVNPSFADAYCGLSHSMNAVCQWNERDAWMQKAIEVCERQLSDTYNQTIGILRARSLDDWIALVRYACGGQLSASDEKKWIDRFQIFLADESHRPSGGRDEAGFLIRLMEWCQTRMQHSWYIKVYGQVHRSEYAHPPQLHGRHLVVRPPPPPPLHNMINIGYVSSDFNDHPLTHLMRSVFKMHNAKFFNVVLYATSPSDGSSHRQHYEAQNDFRFVDVSSWSINAIVDRIVQDQIHILVNLGGYTKGARNEIFAARPCPVQISLMGFAGTLAAGWCDYLVCDPIVCPPDLFPHVCRPSSRISSSSGEVGSDIGVPVNEGGDPASPAADWIYTECPIFMPHTYFVTDHKQSYRLDNASMPEGTPSQRWAEELRRRDELRASIFPDLPKEVIIFANFNQLYKIDPVIFWTWLRILSRVRCSILWLLRFPAAGEPNLLQTATAWAGPEVASRIRFTDVAAKEHHISRCCVADLVLDTAECSAHTIAADVLWSGTPIIACLWPTHRHKMSSRVAASVAYATGLGKHMVVNSREEYEDRAVALALPHEWKQSETAATLQSDSELLDLRRRLFLNRDTMPLFDTARWTRNLEKGYSAAWRRWVTGSQFRYDEEPACITVTDDEDTLLSFA